MVWNQRTVLSVLDALHFDVINTVLTLIGHNPWLEPDLVLEDLLHLSILRKVKACFFELVSASVPEVHMNDAVCLGSEVNVSLDDNFLVLAILSLPSMLTFSFLFFSSFMMDSFL